jgi:hypothetical protein
VGECLIKSRSAGFGATDVIGEDSAASYLLEGITLQVKVLLVS